MAIDKINAEVAIYFATKPLRQNIVIHDSKTSLDDAWVGHNEGKDVKTPSWVVGFATKSQEINILSPKIMPSAGTMTGRQRFRKTLKHEIAHTYINNIDPNTAKWLNEGIAQHVAKQDMYGKIDISKLRLCDIIKLHEELVDSQTYKIGKNIIDEIAKRFGESKVLSLISLNKKQLYQELEDIFGRG